MMKNRLHFAAFFILLFTIFSACNQNNNNKKDDDFFAMQQKFQDILDTAELNSQQRYSIINQMATNYLNVKDYQGLVLFLSDWVEQNHDDMYNSYWLLMTAYAYLSMGAEPVAEYYFDRILQQYQDLLVKGKSIHFMCLQNLIQISKTPAHRIKYFNELINRFPSDVNTTELYLRLAMEYEKDSQWNKALRAYTVFLNSRMQLQFRFQANQMPTKMPATLSIITLQVRTGLLKALKLWKPPLKRQSAITTGDLLINTRQR
ncbi:hypothetical protein [Treponema sp. JC4]|uniref:hypothetical protein n=1 Tax=Treponema sp. JC4 TaxID=1124982 RepID=UPI001ED91447|nr:hypothetical protein [Treponema sp. JC4]